MEKDDMKKIIAGGALIIDVRTPGGYKDGHIKGSLNNPSLKPAHDVAETLKTSIDKLFIFD